MRKSLFLGLALSSALALGGIAMAAPQSDFGGPHGSWHHQHGPHGGHAMFALKKLNLSNSQKTSIRQIIKSSFATGKDQRKALFQQRKAFQSLTPDQSGYQAAADSLAQAEANAARARVEQQASVRAKIYAVLTPAQKMQLASMKAKREQRMQEWKEFRAEHAKDATPGTSK
ncbi:Spy/CpxP family protein refolding chaperone [Dyella sp. A6]|uniref:Spy/CpxP family protein refolding chaperone n=1 Tax=Dyella aluminiiresistens TaxID=3069105 RepID=UPI002E79DEE3|nr:Spy/CpxP family protein refolding chaperone [Dyella sp. A6]